MTHTHVLTGEVIPYRTPMTGRHRVFFETTGVSHVQQHAKAECDVNQIVAKYASTGVLDHDRGPGVYLDVAEIPDFHEAQNIVAAAKEAFAALPAAVRRRFENDPGQFLSFAQDPANIDEMRRLGLAPPERPALELEPEKPKAKPKDPEPAESVED